MITYYTDGSASPNPGPGGFAVIKNGHPYMIGGEPSGEVTTNIRMEGLAIKAALTDSNGEECQIFTDSEFWINVITKWAPGWEAKGWTKKGGEIKNLDIVRDVYPLYKASQAKLTWVRGHEGDEGNEMADKWANKAREKKSREPVLVDEKPVAALTPVDHARTLFAAGQTMQLGTIRDNKPRVNSVYFIESNALDAVYWLSEPTRRHSEDIELHSSVAGAVAVKTDYPVRGVQFEGVASEVRDLDEIKKMCAIYSEKYNGYGSDFPERFEKGTNKHRLYKMQVSSLELFDELYYQDQGPITVI